MSKPNSVVLAILRAPVLWGGLASLGFYALVHAGVIRDPLVLEYVAGHPVEYVEVSLFFVGLAAVVLKACDVFEQRQMLRTAPLDPPRGRVPAEASGELLARLDSLPQRQQEGWLVQRLREALQHVHYAQSADRLDEELKYLADMDADRTHDSYGMVRIINWAIPILGFLGTVIGITMALANLSAEALSDVTVLTSSLSVAFNTTALALGLSIVLMFSQYYAQRAENRLLLEVDRRAKELLGPRFQQLGSGGDPAVAAVRAMADQVVQSCQRLVERQTELWQRSLDEAQSRFASLGEASGTQLQMALDESLQSSLLSFSNALSESTTKATERNHQNWQQVQTALQEAATAVASQQSELVRQGEVLLKVVEATGQVTRLEDALNRNLTALSGAQDFSDTVVSLSAAIQLLSSRLGHAPGNRPVDLGRDESQGHAA